MRLRNITLIPSLLVFLILTACGTADNTPDTNNLGTGSSNDDTRIVSALNGDIEIPRNPQRIADVSGISDILYIIGKKPVATADSDAFDYTIFPTYLEGILEGARIVGYPMSETVDIEGILETNPDLIIINPRQNRALSQLNMIAPTLVIEPDVNDWRSDMRMVADIFEAHDEVEEFIMQYDERAREIGEAIRLANGEDTTYFAFLAAGTDYFLFTGAAFGDIMYNDMGLGIPDRLPEQDDISLPVASLEGLTEINADFMIILASDEDRHTLESSSVWQNMEAVIQDNVIWLPQSPYFNQAYSVYGRNLLIDELKDLLINSN